VNDTADSAVKNTQHLWVYSSAGKAAQKSQQVPQAPSQARHKTVSEEAEQLPTAKLHVHSS